MGLGLVLGVGLLVGSVASCGDSGGGGGQSDATWDDSGPGRDGQVDAGPGQDGRVDGQVITDGGQDGQVQNDGQPPNCNDPDHDGYGEGDGCLGPDCAPDDGAIHPDAEEFCDGVDNDCNGQTDELPQCALPRIWVFVLAGQSNMVGLGYNSELTGIDRNAVPNTAIYYDDSVHDTNSHANQWLGLAPGFGYTDGMFGPELNFGRRFQAYWQGRPVAIIKVAEGGTALHDRWYAPNGDLYQLMMTDVSTQLAALAQNYNPEIVGFVWMQGESDGASDSWANDYYNLFTNFMVTLRQDLGIEHLPSVAGLIAVQDLWPHANLVRNATVRVAMEQGAMGVVETNDLPRHPNDPAHYNTQGQLGLGFRFAEVMATMVKSSYDFTANFTPLQGQQMWFYRDYDGNSSSVPMTYDENNNRWEGSESFELIGPGWMHPGATRDAELVWWAPFTARIQVSITAAAADNGGGDGTWVTMAHDGRVLWGPVAIPNGASETHTEELVVRQGQELEFRTSSGPANDASNDTTSWQIQIQVLDVDP